MLGLGHAGCGIRPRIAWLGLDSGGCRLPHRGMTGIVSLNILVDCGSIAYDVVFLLNRIDLITDLIIRIIQRRGHPLLLIRYKLLLITAGYQFVVTLAVLCRFVSTGVLLLVVSVLLGDGSDWNGVYWIWCLFCEYRAQILILTYEALIRTQRWLLNVLRAMIVLFLALFRIYVDSRIVEIHPVLQLLLCLSVYEFVLVLFE